MEYWILWTFLLALTAVILSVIALFQQSNETTDNSGKIALRSVEALADELGFRLSQYNAINQTSVDKKMYGSYSKWDFKKDKTPATSGDLFIHRQDFLTLLDHLGLEFVEEGRKLAKKKITKK